MFENLTKKIVSGLVALSIALSGFAAVPSLAYAKNDKENHKSEHGWDKNNFGQAVKIWAHFNNDDDHRGLGIGKILSNDDDIVSPSSIQVFKQSLKQAKTDQKTATKDARVTLKTSLQVADTPAEKKSAIRIYLNSLFSAFHAFAVAKEAAFTAFINSF